MTRERASLRKAPSLQLQTTRIARKPLIYSTASIDTINNVERHFFMPFRLPLCASPFVKANKRQRSATEKKVYIIYIPNMFEDKKRAEKKAGEFGWRIVLAQLWFRICHPFRVL